MSRKPAIVRGGTLSELASVIRRETGLSDPPSPGSGWHTSNELREILGASKQTLRTITERLLKAGKLDTLTAIDRATMRRTRFYKLRGKP